MENKYLEQVERKKRLETKYGEVLDAKTTEPAQPKDFKILIVGHFAWGKGSTIEEALEKVKAGGGTQAAKKYIVYLVHPDSTVDGMGAIIHPITCPPHEIQRVGFPKKK